LNLKLLYLANIFKIKQILKIKTPVLVTQNILPAGFLWKNTNTKIKPIIIKKRFLKTSLLLLNTNKLFRFKHNNLGFFFISRFIISFLEFFFKSSIIFNLKKGTNRLILKQISFRKFSTKYFKKNLKTTKQILGVLYYSLLLKDATIFLNFFKKIFEQLNIKLHKKLLLGFRKLIKDFFKPIFLFLGVSGVFFNVKGKIGVSGSAKKRRYFFYFGRHSITNRELKMDLKFIPVWTFTGTLGLTFLIFFN
jgi:hypothetical protein